MNVLWISIGAVLGALLRWRLAVALNPLFPTLPLGTLVCNLLGGALIGCFLAIFRAKAFFPIQLQLGFVTGFLGSLTTFSTFSAEIVTLLSHQQYGWSILAIFAHVFGSIGASLSALFATQWILHRL